MHIIKESFSPTQQDKILKQLDEIMYSTKGLGKGLFVSPLAVDNKKAIAVALPTNTSTIGQQLVTNVKQIKEPGLVYNVNASIDSVFVVI